MWDSLLSEFAAMGFEYGYSVANPRALVSGRRSSATSQTVPRRLSMSSLAQVNRSGTSKAAWLLLPTGTRVKGPDHSSARPERYLQMAAQDNMTIAMPSTPASYFHFLRWQSEGPTTSR